MRRRTTAFLLAGCAFVLALAGPEALSTASRDWRGPYDESIERQERQAGSPRSAAVLRAAERPSREQLARG